MYKKFSQISSTCVPLAMEDIDTDQILPARFLLSTMREGFGDLLFYDHRFDQQHQPRPDFVLNNPSYRGEILVVGNNFGSGSSREHAVWAIAEYGFRVIISTAFADIFRNNALNVGLLPVVVSKDFLRDLFATLQQDPQTKVTVDLMQQTVTNHGSERTESFQIDCYKKHCLLQGLDDIDYLVSTKPQIEAFERRQKCVEIMDTTLRDGEQTSGVSFTSSEKMHIARLLLSDLRVDRIEVASARVSQGEWDSVKKISAWAWLSGNLDKVEVLGFVDGKKSVAWIKQSGVRVMNLLCKGSLRHLTGQLKKTPEAHLADIQEVIAYARQQGLRVNLYLEDWSGGMRDSREYVYFLVDHLQHEPVERFMISDTLGILDTDATYRYCSIMVQRYPQLRFDFHTHNDYDLGVANVLMAVRAGVHGVHTTVNGLGERAGNVPLSSVMAVLKDHARVHIRLDEKKINLVSRMVETFSGVRIPANKPIVGENVFTQACGVHADGDIKAMLYYNDLLPERFGRVRKYALGKVSGTSNVLRNLQELGINMDPEAMKKITERVIALGDRKASVTADDLPYIISDVLHNDYVNPKIKIHNFSLSVAEGLKSVATLSIEIEGKTYEETSAGDGQYDAFMNALHKIYDSLNRALPKLTDYSVTIPPGGKTDALVETVITWEHHQQAFKTRGLDPDQTIAAIKATLKMLNMMVDG